MQDRVRQFHETFGAVINDKPTLEDINTLKLRCNLIHEEAMEFCEAAKAGDLVEMADAIADLLYVTFGAAVSLGIDAEAVFAEVHRSNMTKVWPDGSVRRRDDGKILKPPTFSPPDIEGVLRRLTGEPVVG